MSITQCWQCGSDKGDNESCFHVGRSHRLCPKCLAEAGPLASVIPRCPECQSIATVLASWDVLGDGTRTRAVGYVCEECAAMFRAGAVRFVELQLANSKGAKS